MTTRVSCGPPLGQPGGEVVPLPRRTLTELRTEARIGHYRILVVEGPSDARYLQRWLSDLGWRIVPVPVTAVDPTGIVLGPETFQNNRARVVAFAKEASCEQLRFLVDRDLGLDDFGDVDGLLLTDFPALETYALSEPTLHRLLVHLDRVTYSSLDPEARRSELEAEIANLVRKLGGYLAPLFRLRQVHAVHGSLEFVEDLRRFRHSGSDELDVERIRLVLKLPEDQGPSLQIPTSCLSLRVVAYGHDIARALWAIWVNLRNRNGIADAEALERLLLSLVDPNDLQKLPLFDALETWAA